VGVRGHEEARQHQHGEPGPVAGHPGLRNAMKTFITLRKPDEVRNLSVCAASTRHQGLAFRQRAEGATVRDGTISGMAP
jgi:hypothetical protein